MGAQNTGHAKTSIANQNACEVLTTSLLTINLMMFNQIIGMRWCFVVCIPCSFTRVKTCVP